MPTLQAIYDVKSLHLSTTNVHLKKIEQYNNLCSTALLLVAVKSMAVANVLARLSMKIDTTKVHVIVL
jgi:hypothetical protein